MKKSNFLIVLLAMIAHAHTFAQNISFRKITADNGLSCNTVFTVAQDLKGFMWFGTREGVDRYDGHSLKNYEIHNNTPGIPFSRVNCIVTFNGKLYIGTSTGLYQHDPVTDSLIVCRQFKINANVLTMVPVAGKLYIGTNLGLYYLGGATSLLPQPYNNKAVTAIAALPKSRLLIACGNAALITDNTGRLLQTLSQPNDPQNRKATIYYCMSRKGRNYWIGSNNGLLRFDETDQTLTRVPFAGQESTENNIVRAICFDQKGRMVLGTENGLYIYRPETGETEHYTQSLNYNPQKLNDKAIYAAFTSSDGSVWLGTYFGGVNYSPSVVYGFRNILPGEGNQQLNGKATSQLMEDDLHRLWIGTEDGGISIYDPVKKDFKHISVRTKPFALSINNVHAICNDRAGSIWVGTFLGGLHRFNQHTNTTTVYTRRPNSSNSLSNDQIYTIYKDSGGTLWVGTQHGLNVFDFARNEFHEFKSDIFGREFIYDMLEDTNHDLWFGTNRNGVIRYSPSSNTVTRYRANGAVGDLSSNQVVSVYQDSFDNLWFGTIGGGICLFNKQSNKFTVLNTKNGLPNNNVYGILEDKQQRMWFSTNHGLACYNRHQKTFTNFDIKSGLPSNQFNFKASLKASDGTFYFGSINGVCTFNPLMIRPDQSETPVRFTEFQLFNKTVRPAANTLLGQQLDDVSEINLRYSQNVFSIGYTTLNYSNVRENKYAYYLEGFEQRWNFVKDKYLVTYTNLSPGHYVFHLKTVDISGKAVSSERILVINVAPPFYLSKLAFVLYFLLICIAVWAYARFLRFLNQKDLQLLEERKEKEKTAALNQHRLNFFTFISHEFKTPLTLIIASIEKFMTTGTQEVQHSPELPIIKSNAGRLFKMVQQLMEFRKMETEHASTKVSRHDLVAFVKNIVNSFETLAAGKQIILSYKSTVQVYTCYFDEDKVEKILFNVLSNAIKFTAKGTISITIEVDDSATDRTEAVLTVADTGKGMSSDELSHLFEPFYTDQHSKTGSGIGMALVKSLVDVLNGTIKVDSRPGRGTKVNIRLPLDLTIDDATLAIIPVNPVLPSGVDISLADDTTVVKTREHSVLIIEDNTELLLFLTRHLSVNYSVIQASNGATGFNQVVKYIPDLVISDVKMPVMTGIEFCLKIKKDSRYNHIPVILLSDQAQEDSRIAGLDVGADVYLAKPFSLKELDLLMANMISSRANLRDQLMDTSNIGEEKKPRNNRDQQFMANLNAVLEKQYANSNFTIEQMAGDMNMSRTLLHLNLKKLMDKSATQVLNAYRLKKAIALLKNGLPVVEVAYDCGYADPNYFSRIFKKHYQIGPGAFKVSDETPLDEKVIINNGL